MNKNLTSDQENFLRNLYNKALTKGNSAIYGADVPDSFYTEEDDGVWALPLSDKNGLCGIVLEHDYFENGQWFSWSEDFPMREVIPVE